MNVALARRLGGDAGAVPPLHCDVADPPPDLAPPRALGVSIGGTRPQQLGRRFPATFWIELLRPLVAQRPVVILGGADEAGEAATIAAAVGATSLCGKTPLPVSAGIIRACAAFLGTDGGLVHVAACVGTPVVALFSTTNPWRARPWTPRGRSVVVDVARVPSPKDVGRVRRALTIVEEPGADWVRLGAGGLTRLRQWWQRS